MILIGRWRRLLSSMGFAALLLITGSAVDPHPAAASHSTGATAFYYDMDPFANPANTATSLGSRETCAQILLDGVQNADEDVIDGVKIDVTITSIPSAYPMFAFSYYISYSEAALTVQAREGAFLLAANSGSDVSDFGDTVPDSDGDNFWVGAEADMNIGATISETGSGILQRITVVADPGAATGVYYLTISEAGHVDENNDSWGPDVLGTARLTIGVPCPPADTDSDKVWDVDEWNCGSNASSAVSIPERLDGAFAGVDDDGDTLIDEALPASAWLSDCDGDGYHGSAEDHIYSPNTRSDQDPCGRAPDAAPFNTPLGWPADFKAGGTPDSTNRITLTDVLSFSTPIRRLDTSPGDVNYDRRWDLAPGNSGQAKDINSADIDTITQLYPAMLGGARAFGGPGPLCPWPE